MLVIVQARLLVMPGSMAKLPRIMATRSTLVTQTPRKRSQLMFGLSAGMTEAGGALAFCRLESAISFR